MILRTTLILLALAMPFAAARALTAEPDPAQPEEGAAPLSPALAPATPGDAGSETGAEPAGAAGGSAALPRILRAESEMPEAVRETRRKLMEAAKSGDLEQLRALMNAQPQPPSVSLGDPGDPIEYLKALSSDADGREILAILLEVLESGFVRVEPGGPEELYVWPYFAQLSLETLTPAQLVELFTLLTAADYEDMRSYGSYTFFRVGIAPDGRWLFFLAGD